MLTSLNCLIGMKMRRDPGYFNAAWYTQRFVVPTSDVKIRSIQLLKNADGKKEQFLLSLLRQKIRIREKRYKII